MPASFSLFFSRFKPNDNLSHGNAQLWDSVKARHESIISSRAAGSLGFGREKRVSVAKDELKSWPVS